MKQRTDCSACTLTSHYDKLTKKRKHSLLVSTATYPKQLPDIRLMFSVAWFLQSRNSSKTFDFYATSPWFESRQKNQLSRDFYGVF